MLSSDFHVFPIFSVLTAPLASVDFSFPVF